MTSLTTTREWGHAKNYVEENVVIHGAQTPKYKIVYVNHLPEYCPVMNYKH